MRSVLLRKYVAKLPGADFSLGAGRSSLSREKHDPRVRTPDDRSVARDRRTFMPRHPLAPTPTLFLLITLLAGPSVASTGGPDGFGYTFTDSAEVSGPAFNWLPTSSTLSVPEDGSTVVALPFTFSFYGTSYSTVSVGEDGVLTFLGSSPGANNSCLPSVGAPAASVWWEDWAADEGQSPAIATGTVGVAPNRVFVVAWTDIENDQGEDEGSFQAHIFEGGTALEFHYLDVNVGGGGANAGGNGTVGIEGVGSMSLQYSCSAPNLYSGLAVRFEVTCFDGDGDSFWDCVDDCDDAEATVNPAAADACPDGIDQDCSGADATGDADGDGFVSTTCGGVDCDDALPAVHPGATETCDGVDEDCSGVADDADHDGDGFSLCEDCDDTDPETSPDAMEICGDGVDQDCDGSDPVGDVDDDGWVGHDCGGGDCDDADPDVHPEAEDVCNGADDDCDGASDETDFDGDGFMVCEDCDDLDSDTSPDAREVCDDDLDNDCDGLADLDDPDCDESTGDDGSGDDEPMLTDGDSMVANGCDCSSSLLGSPDARAALSLLVCVVGFAARRRSWRR